ncbi:hypothetical protein C2G38_2115623 [Gigaspora rosea]|uniref:Uncharacterized protein n=1 Tax=Gigaspora rosea TaxID=44941 RepID=A0A397U8P9_9GLOM|nr:hypothetical protein C2G38_2115623 [Gigaspora rosea]
MVIRYMELSLHHINKESIRNFAKKNFPFINTTFMYSKYIIFLYWAFRSILSLTYFACYTIPV